MFLIVVSVDEAKPFIAAPAYEGSLNLIGFLNVTLDRAPARIPAATKPIDAANITNMTMIQQTIC